MTADPPPRLVTLRPLQEGDASLHAAIPPSAEIARMYGGGSNAFAGPDPERSRRWLMGMQADPYARMIETDGQPVGHIRLHSLVRADRRARLAIGLFAEADLGRGIGRQAIARALDHAFGAMDLHRVDLRVLAFNTRAIRCYAACGFVHEGTEREAAFIDGQWHDDWIMAILSHEHAASKA
ncbi:GNAT family N-acetyltransferase [Rhodobacter sp. NTK016B]|uniref:GNAT family N-acetyltransferase n=1 Tax=Rhodobacter sp. NTK016B TaxID=2759676 RepID=UPI001A8D8ADA|nr:GNAT family protein [Rhodobacter sp. NTK016B]MBN8292690.1 GNAT family N-acetyltransferase [Rhodobacter sp. NTK016B]